MIESRHSLILLIAVPITLVLATSGCATKKYVREQVTPVSQKVATFQTETGEIAWRDGAYSGAGSGQMLRYRRDAYRAIA